MRHHPNLISNRCAAAPPDRVHIWLIAAILLLMVGCSKRVTRPSNEAREIGVLGPQVSELSARAQALLHEQDEMIWKHWTEGAPLNISKTYEGKENLFGPDSIEKVDRFRNLNADLREKKAATHLLVHFIGEYLARSLADETEAIANLESSIGFTYSGKEIPLRSLDRMISSEKSQAKREAMYAAATPAIDRFSQLIRIRRDKAEEKLQALGFSYVTYSSLLREADFAEVRALADQFLTDTEASYKKSLSDLSKRELQEDAGRLRRVDLIKLLHGNRLDAPFGKDLLIELLHSTAQSLSMNLSAMNNVKLDSTDSARKNPQPLCLAITVPSDIRLSIRPVGGERIYSSALHELGHLLHFSTSQEGRFELAKLGNSSLHESFAMIFEDLILDETWLASNLSFPKDKAADFLSHARFKELYRLRLAAAHVLYEISLHSEPARDPKAIFEAIFGRAFGINLNAEEVARYQVEQEDLYASVDTLRAAAFSAQLLADLKQKFGMNWWQFPEAGQFLRDLWAPGNGISIDDAAKKLGDAKLSVTALIQRFSGAVDNKPESTTQRDGGVQ